MSDRLVRFLDDPAAINTALGCVIEAAPLRSILQGAQATATLLTTAPPDEQRHVLDQHIAAIDLHEDRVDITVRLSVLGSIEGDPHHVLTTAATRIRSGHDVKLIVAAPQCKFASNNAPLRGGFRVQ